MSFTVTPSMKQTFTLRTVLVNAEFDCLMQSDSPSLFAVGGHTGCRLLLEETHEYQSVTEFSLTLCVPAPVGNTVRCATDCWVNTGLGTA